MVNSKVAQDPLVELETDLPRIPVIHPLGLGIVHCLAGVLVLQLKGEDGDAVQDENHVHAVVIIGAVKPLAVAGHVVTGILGCCQLVQVGLGLEEADVESDAAMLEAMPQHGNQAVHVTGIIEGIAELPHGVNLVGILEPGPLLWLSLLDEVNQGVDVEAQLRVIGIGTLLVSTGG